MTFQTYHSQRVEDLRDDLISRMFSGLPKHDLFSKEHVLVDNRVLGDWLNMEIARSQQIAANIDYVQPHELFWNLARQLLGEETVPKETPLSKDEMTWKLYGLLGEVNLLKEPDMLPVKNYLQGDNKTANDEVELKRYQLSVSIADLFDQYLVYRPDWILSWSKGKAITHAGWKTNDIENEKWQRHLWQAISQSSSHRAAIEQALLSTLDNAPGRLKEKISMHRLFVFGMTSMPPRLVDMLMLLGKHIDVSVYVLNPCEEYWSLIRDARTLAKQEDISLEEMHYEIGNPLLASLGVQVRDFISLMQERGDDNPESLFAGESAEECQPHSLLEWIQHEIKTLAYQDNGQKRQVVEQPLHEPLSWIPSIHIHQCHSVMREVEVLHDQVRDMLSQNKGMNPRDIVVMMPRVAPYVGAIHAVFNSVQAKDRIDYHITDRTQAEESPLLNSLVSLLRLPESRLPLSEVIALLEVPALQRRFGLDAAGYAILKRWLVESGVRWGRDAEHRRELGLPAYAEASWQFGRDRLLAGYAFHADDTGADTLITVNGLAVQPYDHIEGGNAELLNSFLVFWNTLEHWRKQLDTPATAAVWALRLRSMLDDFFEATEEQEHIAMKAARECIHALDTLHDKQWFAGEIPLRVIRDVVQPALEKHAGSQNPWQEGIKFCSLMPMRGVPFRAIYIMGMNMDDYPRRIEKRSFDLMRQSQRRGDRASRIDDRWLFLEALLSARQYFHVSYIARDIHRNEKREPSVVLSELIDYCKQGYVLPAHALQTEHPLQPFGVAYFVDPSLRQSPRLVSFNREACRIANTRRQQQASRPAADTRWLTGDTGTAVLDTPMQVSQQELIRFFTKPWDWFFKHKHRVYLEVEDHSIEDEENLEAPDSLQQWGLRNELIAMVSAGKTPPSAIDELVKKRLAEGNWPLGSAGYHLQATLSGLNSDYLVASRGAVKHGGKRLRIGSGNTIIDLECEWLLDEATQTHLFHTASSKNDSNELEFYLRTALAAEAFPDLQLSRGVFYNSKTKKGYDDITLPLSGAAQQDNRDFLNLLARYYVTHYESGLPFEPGLGRELAELADEEVEEAIENAWNEEKSEWSAGGIAFDNRKRSYFGHIEAITAPIFLNTCRQVWQAVYARYPHARPVKKNKGQS